MKYIGKNFWLFSIGLILAFGIMTACSSSKDESGKSSTETAGNHPATGNSQESTSENVETAAKSQTKENKTVVGNINTDSAANNQQTEIKEFSAAANAGEDKMSGFPNWKIIYGADQINIDFNGRGKRITSTNVTSETNFTLPLPEFDVIDNVFYFAKYKEDWIFLFGLSRGGDGSGMITRLDGKTLKPKWNASLGGFNVGNALRENQFAYLSAIGFAGKIDLESGKFVWKHDDFYRKYKKDGAFNSFEIPQVEGNTVVFTEKLESSAFNSIIFDKNDGKVVKVNVQ